MPQLVQCTLQQKGSITKVVSGSFTAPRANELILCRGGSLELLTIVSSTQRLETLFSIDTYSTARDICAFRVMGTNKDNLVLTSDAGRVVLLEANLADRTFDVLHKETYGKTGIRRVMPGYYIASDPKGRSFMIGAPEKMKFLYLLSKDADSGKIKVSSPLESHKDRTICLDMIGVDVGFDSPVFATLEVCYEAVDKLENLNAMLTEEEITERAPTMLVFWELDIGLNHVVRKCTMQVPSTAHKLIGIPEGTPGQEGVSGLLVCCENYIVFKKPDAEDIYCAYPRRLETNKDRGINIICFTSHKLRHSLFYLIQTELGDLYKIDLELKNGEVSCITCTYFDSIPLCVSMCVLRIGALFCAHQAGDHAVYKFLGLGSDASEAISSNHPHGKNAIVPFRSRNLKNLALHQTLPSMAPLVRMKAYDILGKGSPQLMSLCGQGARGSLRILEHGIAIEEIASNELPGRPIGVWAFKSRMSLPHDDFLVVSFSDASLILSIGESVEECTNSPFHSEVKTILIHMMIGDVIVQVHSRGMRLVQHSGSADKPYTAKQWTTPGNRLIVAATANKHQIAIGVIGGDLFVFEVNAQGQAIEVGRKALGEEIVALHIPSTTGEERTAPYLAVASADGSVRLLSLTKAHALRQVSALGNPYGSSVEGVVLLRLEANDGIVDSGGSPLFLFVGLHTGIMIRCIVDSSSGHLLDQRGFFQDSFPMRLQQVNLQHNQGDDGEPKKGIFILGKKSYATFAQNRRIVTLPVHNTEISHITSFQSQLCQSGFMACCGMTLKVFQFDVGTASGSGLSSLQLFSPKSVPLTFTPRHVLILPPPPTVSPDGNLSIQAPNPTPSEPLRLVVIETDHGVYDVSTAEEIKSALKTVTLKEETKPEEIESPDPAIVGHIKAGVGEWGSVIRTVNPATGQTLHALNLDVDEAAVCGVVCCFVEFPEQPCVVVGTTFGPKLHPEDNEQKMGSIKVFAYDNTYELTLLHSTPIEDAPVSMTPYKGQLLVGLGKKVRLYSLGKKKVLRKGEYNGIPESAVFLKVIGERIYVGDVVQGFQCLRYHENRGEFQLVAQSGDSCYLSCGLILDYHTVMGADKFGNVFVYRLPESVRTQPSDPTKSTIIQGTPVPRMERLNMAHIGDIVTSLEKTILAPGRSEVIVYTTIMGKIGVFLPVTQKDDYDFLELLEMVMRDAAPPISGREHVSYRSYYAPIKNVLDGDYCLHYTTLPKPLQDQIAKRIEKTTVEVCRKLEDMQMKIL